MYLPIPRVLLLGFQPALRICYNGKGNLSIRGSSNTICLLREKRVNLSMNLEELGWNDFFKKQFSEMETEETFPARVATAHGELYSIYSESGELQAEISGKLRFDTILKSSLPAVGDWVVAKMRPEGDSAIIEGVLPRLSKFSRKVAGSTTDEQVLVANINTVFLVNGLDGDYNLRRIERYLAIGWDSNAKPVIILNKTDVCRDVQGRIAEVEAISFDVPICALSALKNKGIESLKEYINKGTTVAFLGSSGVGKSSIINSLLGEERLKVGAVREEDSRGRHITSIRELIILPGGGIVIDNPGLREVQMWMDEDKLEEAFRDIKRFAVNCKFKDCRHISEPGCAVKDAIAKGGLDEKRFQSYIKLKKELRYLATRKNEKARNEKIITEKKISKWSKQIKKHKKKYEF